MTDPKTNLTLLPYTILIDHREKAPYAFTELLTQQGAPLCISTRTTQLASGDYSLDGFSDHCAVERKSIADLYHTIARHRRRFQSELVRLSNLEFSCVIVEATWEDIRCRPPPNTRLPPAAVLNTVSAWRNAFPSTEWYFLDGRREAELATFYWLYRITIWSEHGCAVEDLVESEQIHSMPDLWRRPQLLRDG